MRAFREVARYRDSIERFKAAELQWVGSTLGWREGIVRVRAL